MHANKYKLTYIQLFFYRKNHKLEVTQKTGKMIISITYSQNRIKKIYTNKSNTYREKKY